MNVPVDNVLILKKDKEIELENVIFVPPLYQQRYIKVIEIMKNNIPNGTLAKVLDIGCAELGFFKYLKRMDQIKEVVLFDIDLQLLKEQSFRVNPLPYDYIIRRKNQFDVSIICGDAKFHHTSFINTDVITMIEFIEHLHLHELPAIVSNIFGITKPNLVVITTPNADYNKHFPGFETGKFRHYDHKFEWTKKQFQEWCLNIVEEYQCYEVCFTGCGEDKDGIFCSQIGIFSNQMPIVKFENLCSDANLDNAVVSSPCEGCLVPWKEFNSCKIVHSVKYPYDSRSSEQVCVDYLLSSLYELRTWLQNQIDLSNDELQFRVPYVHTDSFDISCLNKENSHQLTNEKLLYATKECTGSIGIDKINVQLHDIVKIVDDKILDEITSAKMMCPANSNSNDELVNIQEEPCKSICHDSLRISVQPVNTEKTSSVTEKESKIFKRNDNSSYFTFIVVKENFRMLDKNILEERPSQIFYYLESEESVLFTSTTFSKWANLKANDNLIRETLEKEEIICFDATRNLFQLSISRVENTDFDTD